MWLQASARLIKVFLLLFFQKKKCFPALPPHRFATLDGTVENSVVSTSTSGGFAARMLGPIIWGPNHLCVMVYYPA
jgi:hypothetical protein